MKLWEAAARMAVAATAIKEAEHAALETAAQIVETRAKNYIGVPHPWWSPLKPETIAGKDGVNSPLLDTGQMRDSIEHTVAFPSAFVGSNDDRAVYQELGTSRGIPPRSFLGHAAQASGPEIASVVSRTVGGAIGASLGGRSVEMEILKIAGEALHHVYEAGEEILTHEDEQSQ